MRYFCRLLILIVFMVIMTSGELKSCGCLWTDFRTSWVIVSIRSRLRANSRLITLFTSSEAATSDLDFSRPGRGWLRSMSLMPKCSRPSMSPETMGLTVSMWTGLSHFTWIGAWKVMATVLTSKWWSYSPLCPTHRALDKLHLASTFPEWLCSCPPAASVCVSAAVSLATS